MVSFKYVRTALLKEDLFSLYLQTPDTCGANALIVFNTASIAYEIHYKLPQHLFQKYRNGPQPELEQCVNTSPLRIKILT
jgi:hypothetical protein